MRFAALCLLLAACNSTPAIHCYLATDAGVSVCRRIALSERPIVTPGERATFDLATYCRSNGGMVTNGCDAGTAPGECERINAFTDEYDRYHATETQARRACVAPAGRWIPDRD